MPYCQECGSYIDPDTNNCGSCGNKLIDVELTSVSQSEANSESEQLEADGNVLQSSDTVSPTGPTAPVQEEITKEPELLEKNPDESSNTSTVSALKESPSGFIPQEGISVSPHWNQIDSHLGRGLIKPVAIENCMDGYHFKYDEPPCQIIKPEQQKDKPIEFRFTGEFNPGDEAGKVVETNEVVEKNEVEEVGQEHSDATGVEPEKDGPEVAPEQIAEPGSDLGTVTEDNNLTADNQDKEIPVQDGEALVEDFGFQENDLTPGVDAEPENFWKGHRSWYGLTLKEEYRVTAQSLVVINDSGRVLKEIEWQSVSWIELKQNWLSKWLNIGNLELIGVNAQPLFILEGIDHPEQLQKMLVENIGLKYNK